MLWEFFDRQNQGRIDVFQFGVAVKQVTYLPKETYLSAKRDLLICQKTYLALLSSRCACVCLCMCVCVCVCVCID